MDSLATIVAKINKESPGTLIRGSDICYDELPRITSGSLALDVALGGGWPANQWIEAVGEFSSGKSTLITKTIAANQARDPNWSVWWVAAEPFNTTWAEDLGVDLKRVFVHDTNVAQVAFQKVLDVAETREVDCIVIDSLPALVPIEEDDKGMAEIDVGTMAKLNNKFWRKQGTASRRSLVDPEDRPITGFVVNQWREKIGGYGDPRTTPGGKMKDFAYFVQVETRRSDHITVGKERVGIIMSVTTRKNKSFRPFMTADVGFYYTDAPGHAKGSYDVIREARDLAISFDIFKLAGSWYTYIDSNGEEHRWQGREGISKALEADIDLFNLVSQDVMAVVKPAIPPPVQVATKAPRVLKGVKPVKR